MKRALSSGGSRGGARGAHALPLIFRPNWGPKSQKTKENFVETCPPPPPPSLSQGLGDQVSPLSKGLDPPMLSVIRSQAPTITRSNMYLSLYVQTIARSSTKFWQFWGHANLS